MKKIRHIRRILTLIMLMCLQKQEWGRKISLTHFLFFRLRLNDAAPFNGMCYRSCHFTIFTPLFSVTPEWLSPLFWWAIRGLNRTPKMRKERSITAWQLLLPRRLVFSLYKFYALINYCCLTKERRTSSNYPHGRIFYHVRHWRDLRY